MPQSAEGSDLEKLRPEWDAQRLQLYIQEDALRGFRSSWRVGEPLRHGPEHFDWKPTVRYPPVGRHRLPREQVTGRDVTAPGLVN
jgi:hypothetical protein